MDELHEVRTKWMTLFTSVNRNIQNLKGLCALSEIMYVVYTNLIVLQFIGRIQKLIYKM